MTSAASLAPVSGDPSALLRQLETWLSAPGPRTLVIRTSGSTGEPKDVALSAAALQASAAATAERLGGPGQWLLALPVAHVAGLQVLVRSILGGTTPVLLDEHADVVSATEALRHTRRFVSIVPTQLQRWLGDAASQDALAGYDAVLVGGGALDRSTLAQALECGIRIVTTYGMTETCGGCVYDGIPLDGVGVRLDPGGLICLSGPVLFDGYVGRADLTEAALRKGWFGTADYGRFDDDGRLEVVGRADDVAVSGGVKVPLGAVQRRLATMPGLVDTAVVAVPDPEWGHRVLAFVTPGAGATAPALATVRDYVGAELPRSWAPREVVVVDNLPRLDSGKVDMIALRAGLRGRP